MRSRSSGFRGAWRLYKIMPSTAVETDSRIIAHRHETLNDYDTKAILALWHNSNEARKSVVGKMVGMMLDDIQRKQLIPVFDVSKQRAGVMINDF